MTKMRSLSALAVTLMLAGVLAACGSDKAASPAATDSAKEAIENTPAAADNDAHPTDETDIDMAEEAPSDTDSATPADTTESTPADSGTNSGSESSDKETSGTPSADTDTDTGKTDAAETAKPTESSNAGESKAPASAPAAAAAEQTGEGSYSGLADSHSAEIDVDGKAVTYQLSEEAQKQINQIPNDAKVTFKYTEDKIDDTTTVLTITEIQEAK